MRGLTAAAAAVLIAFMACSGSSSSKDGGGGSGATGGTGGATAGTCQAIRICALDCADDACVMNNCKPMGTADAQTTFQALYDCLKDPARGNCTSPSDINCLCLAECLQDPPCAAEVDACTMLATDVVCEGRCH